MHLEVVFVDSLFHGDITHLRIECAQTMGQSRTLSKRDQIIEPLTIRDPVSSDFKTGYEASSPVNCIAYLLRRFCVVSVVAFTTDFCQVTWQ